MYVVLLTTVLLFNGQPEIHVYRESSRAVCIERRDAFLREETNNTGFQNPTFATYGAAACKVFFVGLNSRG